MEKNKHIEVIGELIERNKNLEMETDRLKNREKRESDKSKNNLLNNTCNGCKTSKYMPKAKANERITDLKSSYLKTPTSQKKLASATNPKNIFRFYTEEKVGQDQKALKIEKDMTKYAIQKMLSNIEKNSKEVIRKNNKPKKKKCFKRTKRSPDQLFNDLNRQSYTIKIKKYKNPKLVHEAIKLPQSEIETLEYAQVQTPLSMKFGEDKRKILNSKFEFYRTYMNSNLKRRLFNQWLSKWSRIEIKKLRNELRKAIVNVKDDIEEKKRYSRDYVPDSVYEESKNKINNDDNEKEKQDTPVNMDTYNENFLKEDIFIDPNAQEQKLNEKYQQNVDYYIGGE